MNGWTVSATMSSANGDGFGVRVDSPRTGGAILYAGVYISATDTVRLVADYAAAPAGAGGDPTYTVTTGGNLDVEIRLDCDRPAAANGATLDYYVGGVLAGSRVISFAGGANTFPGIMPIYYQRNHYLYRRNTTTTSSEAMTRWDNDAAAVAGTFGTTLLVSWKQTAPFSVLPPVGGVPLLMPSGEQLLARPFGDTTLAANVGAWRRQGPGAAWVRVAEYATGGPYTNAGPTTLGCQVHGAEPPWAFLDETWVSLDGLDTADSLTQVHRYYVNEPVTHDGLTVDADAVARLAPTCIFTDRHDRVGMAAKLDFRDGREQVYVVGSWPGGTADNDFGANQAAHARYTVDAAVRTAGNEDSRPHPWVHRGADGRWRVAWFVNDAPAEYRSDDLLGESWTALSPTSDATAGYLNLVATNFWRGRDGRQAVAGYHFGEEEFVVLTRGGEGQPWTGPYLSVSSATAAAPYIYERADGRWEVGWLIGGTWTIYRALWPGGSWAAV